MKQRWESWKNKYGRWCYEAAWTSEYLPEHWTTKPFYQSWSHNSNPGPASFIHSVLSSILTIPLTFPALSPLFSSFLGRALKYFHIFHCFLTLHEQIKLSAFWANIESFLYIPYDIFPCMSRWQLPIGDRRCSHVQNLIYPADKLFMP